MKFFRNYVLRPLLRSNRRMLGIIFVLFLAIAVPITLNVVQHNQDIRQHAAGGSTCSLSTWTVTPPKDGCIAGTYCVQFGATYSGMTYPVGQNWSFGEGSDGYNNSTYQTYHGYKYGSSSRTLTVSVQATDNNGKGPNTAFCSKSITIPAASNSQPVSTPTPTPKQSAGSPSCTFSANLVAGNIVSASVSADNMSHDYNRIRWQLMNAATGKAVEDLSTVADPNFTTPMSHQFNAASPGTYRALAQYYSTSQSLPAVYCGDKTLTINGSGAQPTATPTSAQPTPTLTPGPTGGYSNPNTNPNPGQSLYCQYLGQYIPWLCPSPTATPAPTSSPTSTPEPSGGAPTPTGDTTPAPTGGVSTTMNVAVKLPGIGVSSGDNNAPGHNTRPAMIQLFDLNNNKVAQYNPVLAYSSSDGLFEKSVTVNLPAGYYYIKVKIANSLVKRVPGIVNMQQGAQISSPVTLVFGDLNNNNIMDLADYQIFLSCYGDKQCSQKSDADLNDDGNVDIVDYNILLRSFAIHEGD